MQITLKQAPNTQHRVFVVIALLVCGLGMLTSRTSGAVFGTPLWTNRYDGPAQGEDFDRAMAVSGNDTVFITGGANRSGSNLEFATVAYSNDGVPLWTNLYNGAINASDEGYAVVVDKDGNVIVTGVTQVAPFNETSSGFDYVTIKYSTAGVPLWINTYNGPGDGDDTASAVAVDNDGNVIVTGGSARNSVQFDYVTIKYTSAGVPLWTNRDDTLGVNGVFARALVVDGSGSIVVGGPWGIVAYSAAGVPLWTNRTPGAMDMVADGNGNLFAAGNKAGDYATVAFSSAGVPLWTNLYKGTGNSSDYPRGIAVDRSGNVFVTGYSYDASSGSTYATVAYSGSGTPLWTNLFGGGYARGLVVDGSGNVVVTGLSGGEYVTLAYSGAGVPLWTNRTPGGSDGTLNRGIALDGDGNIFVTGSVGSPSDFVTVKYAGINSTPPMISQVTADNGQFQLLFNAESNRAYIVEFRDSLENSLWATLTNFPANPMATDLTVTNAMTTDARFYRVRSP